MEYLKYWRKPEYLKYLQMPRCLDFVDMLLREEIRREIRDNENFVFMLEN